MAVRPALMISSKLFMDRAASPRLHRYQVQRSFAIPAARSFYELLGLNERASQEEIRTAFRRLAKEKHPDVSQDDNSEQEFMQLKQAYDTLTDAAARAHYDWNLQQQTASRSRTAPDGGRSSSVRPPGSGYGNPRSGSGFRTRQATPQDVHRRRHDGQRLSRSSSSRDARPQRYPYHHQQQQTPTYHAPSPVGGSGRRRPEGWVGSWPLPSNQQSAASRGTLGPSGEDDWSGTSAAGNRSGVTAGATPRVGPSGAVGVWGDDWPHNPRAANPTNHTAPPATPSGGDDWGSWAAAANAARSNVVSSNGGGRSQGGQPAPAGPVSGDDWNTYAHVVTLGGAQGSSSSVSRTAGSSASNEWPSVAGAGLSFRDDLEGYSDVVLSTSTSSPLKSPSAAVLDAAATAAEGSRGAPSSAHIGDSSSGGGPAISGAFDQGAIATRPADLSSGDDFELYSDVVDMLPASSNGSGANAANLKDLGEQQQAATGLVASPATSAAAVLAPQAKGDDFELLSMSAAMPGDSAALDSDESHRDSVAATAPAVSPSPTPPPSRPSGDDFALLAFLASIRGDASAAAAPSQSAEEFAHSHLKGVSFSGARSVWERSLPSEQPTKQESGEPSPLPSKNDGDALEMQPPLPDPAMLVGESKPPSAALESRIEEPQSVVSEKMSSDSGLSTSTDLYYKVSGRVPGDGTRGWAAKQADDTASPFDVGTPAASWSNASGTLPTPALPPSPFTGRSMPYSSSVLAAALASANVSSAMGGLVAHVTSGGDGDGHADMTLPVAAVGKDDDGNAGQAPVGLQDLDNSILQGGEPGATETVPSASECRASDDEGRGAGVQETLQQQQKQDQPEHRQEQEGTQEAPGPASGLSFSDAWDMSEGWRRSISPIKSAGIYFSDRVPATDGGGGGGGGGGGSIFSKPQPEVTPRKAAGSIFGNPPSQPPPKGRR